MWVGVGPGSLGLDRVFQLVANVACCSCWCSFCSAGGRDVMAYHPALLLHAVGAHAAPSSSTVAITSSAPKRWHLVGLPAVFSLPRASYACYQPAAPHSSSPHYHERIPRRAPLTFRACFVGSGAKDATADDCKRTDAAAVRLQSHCSTLTRSRGGALTAPLVCLWCRQRSRGQRSSRWSSVAGAGW